ncbi:hypothetical protein GCM10022402_10720 [Salinactinospora qingdaonensis]|uniref:Uncharacterized protein n=1 Tax=Salinactinospora qingdaonensis TaxID=702744 RepID=A0ABP7F5F5_9ACTN
MRAYALFPERGGERVDGGAAHGVAGVVQNGARRIGDAIAQRRDRVLHGKGADGVAAFNAFAALGGVELDVAGVDFALHVVPHARVAQFEELAHPVGETGGADQDRFALAGTL